MLEAMFPEEFLLDLAEPLYLKLEPREGIGGLDHRHFNREQGQIRLDETGHDGLVTTGETPNAVRHLAPLPLGDVDET